MSGTKPEAKSTGMTFTEAEVQSILAVIKQTGIGSNIDLEQFRIDVGAPSKNAAGTRLSRLRTKLGIAATKKGNRSPAGTPNGKGKGGKGKNGTPAKKEIPSKKRKAPTSDNEDDGEEEVGADAVEGEADGTSKTNGKAEGGKAPKNIKYDSDNSSEASGEAEEVEDYGY